MGRLHFDIDVTPDCMLCQRHARIERDRLWDSFREVALAARARGEKSGLRELRMSYFQAYHDRGHLKTEDGLELDGELLDSY